MSKRIGARGRDAAARRRRRLALTIVLLLAVLSFGCITLTVSTSVIPAVGPGEEDIVWLELEQRMDGAFSKWAHEANADLQAQYGAEYKPSMRFPEYLDDLPSELRLIKPEEMQKQGFVKRAESIYLLRYGKRFALGEYASFLSGKENAPAPTIIMTADPATGLKYYHAEFTLEGLGDADTWKDWDWNEWDKFKATPMGPKPQADLAKEKQTPEVKIEDEEAQRALELSGLDRLVSGAFSAIADVAPSPLQEWWAQRILKEMGFPTILQFEISLPGKITRHQLKNESVGQLVGDDKVVIALDEAFLRKHGFTGPWTFVVESVMEPLVKSQEENATSEKKPTTPGEPGEKFWNFRLRQVGWAAGANGLLLFGRTRNLPIIKDWAPFAARYEFTELREDGSVGRRCYIQFTGTGLSVGLPYTVGFPIDRDGSVFKTRKGMRLEDFDNMPGTMTSVGGFIGGYNKITFGGIMPDSIVARVEGWGWFLGLHGGWSPMYGRWDIVGSPTIPF